VLPHPSECEVHQKKLLLVMKPKDADMALIREVAPENRIKLHVVIFKAHTFTSPSGFPSTFGSRLMRVSIQSPRF